MRINREGLGSQWWIIFPDDSNPLLGRQINQEIDRFEKTYSRFLPSSLIGRINYERHLDSPPIELLDILTKCEEMRLISDGYFNVGIGASLERLGYGADYTFKAGEPLIRPGSAFSELSSKRISLAPNAQIDLGGIGKGWLIDQLALICTSTSTHNFLINGGGDIRVGQEPQRLTLEHPFDVSLEIGTITIRDQAVAASGSGKRRWVDQTDGKMHHHLVDPYTGSSSNTKAATYTLGPTATIADVASTILYLIPEQKIDHVASLLGVEFLLVYPNGASVKSEKYPASLHG